jgi:TolA-binding protein
VTDRRSFSEIPRDLLRDQGVDARVDRVWDRLEKALDGAKTRPRRLEAHRGALAFAAVTFALGVFVGTRFSDGAPVPIAALAAEPSRVVGAAASTPHAQAAPALSGRTEQAAPKARRVATVQRSFAPSRPEPEPSPAPEPVVPAAVAEWPRLAEEGQYEQALRSLEASGGFESALAGASADQLMSLVDIARATGQRERGVLALRRIVTEHASDPNAPVAAWMLANELAKSRDLAGAEQAFATYRALSPSGDFAEDALARQVDMAAEQGSLERAKRLAGQYLKEFPDGPRSADIQAQYERWSREAPQAAGADEANVAGLRAATAPDAGTAR